MANESRFTIKCFKDMEDMDAAAFKDCIVQFNFKGQVLNYLPSQNNAGWFLCSAGRLLESLYTDSFSNQEIFTLLNLNRREFCKSIIEYNPGEGDWPEATRINDLKKVVSSLFVIIEINNINQ